MLLVTYQLKKVLDINNFYIYFNYSATEISMSQMKNEGEAHRQRKENQAVAQLVLIVVSYLIGYIPTTGEFMS